MKMAGLGLKENSSGTKKGRKHINKRGRAQLRRILKLTALSLIKNNDEFKSLHKYYTEKREKCLEKLVSVNAIIHKFNLDSSLCFISLVVCMTYPAYKLNKQSDNIQP